MSSELDSVNDPEADKECLKLPLVQPYVLPEVGPTCDPNTDEAGLSKPASRPFDIDSHLAKLESQVSRWVPIALISLMVLTFGSLIFGPNDAHDVTIQAAALFLSVISGTLGYVFGRQAGR